MKLYEFTDALMNQSLEQHNKREGKIEKMRLDMVEVLERLGYGNLTEAFEQDDNASKDRRKVMRMTFDIAYTPLDDDDILYEPMNDPNNIYEGLVDDLSNFTEGITLVDSKMEDITDKQSVNENKKRLTYRDRSKLTEANDDSHVTQVSFDVTYKNYDAVDEFIDDVHKLNKPGQLSILGYDCQGMDDQYANWDYDFDESLNEAKKELPIRKALTDANIMAGLDKDPIAAIKKAIAAVESSADVSEADKNKFKREMTTGSLNKRLSTLATYAYDINKATLK